MSIKTGLVSFENPFGGLNLTSSHSSLKINDLPNELIVKIFDSLDFKGCLSAKRACRHWDELIREPTTAYSSYLSEINAVKKFAHLPPRFSAWETMPSHWGLISKEMVLKFSSISRDIIAFFPPFAKQSSRFFSFTLPTPFSNRYIFLDKNKNTYFLTPQSQRPFRLELPTNLQPFAGHELIATNFSDPSKNRRFSILRDLPATPENLSHCQIEHCFPISESKVAIVTSGGKISFWDLSSEVPDCFLELQIEAQSTIIKTDKHLILDHSIIDLHNPSLIGHGFEFQHDDIKTFGSSFCAYNGHKKEIRLFVINDAGLLEKKWDLSAENLLQKLDQTNGKVLALYVKDMDEEFILLTCWQNRAVTLFVLNRKGELVHSICEKAIGKEWDQADLSMPPIFSHLSGHVLVYKSPQEHAINFWHIPAGKSIQKFEWTKSIFDLPLASGDGHIQDIRLLDGKLTVLLSSRHSSLSNKPGKFRLIEFDPEHTCQPGLKGVLSRIYSAAKGIYYAFPGKKPFG